MVLCIDVVHSLTSEVEVFLHLFDLLLKVACALVGNDPGVRCFAEAILGQGFDVILRQVQDSGQSCKDLFV